MVEKNGKSKAVASVMAHKHRSVLQTFATCSMHSLLVVQTSQNLASTCFYDQTFHWMEGFLMPLIPSKISLYDSLDRIPLNDWLIDWLIDWMIDWLVGWLVDWLIGWLTDWLNDWSIDTSTIHPLIQPFTDPALFGLSLLRENNME